MARERTEVPAQRDWPYRVLLRKRLDGPVQRLDFDMAASLKDYTGGVSLLPHEWKRLTMMLVALLALTGCMTTYEVIKQTPEGDVRVLVKSFREFEQPQIHYSRQGQDVTFDFGAESATTASSPVEEAFGEAIKAGAVVLRPVGGGGDETP